MTKTSKTFFMEARKQHLKNSKISQSTKAHVEALLYLYCYNVQACLFKKKENNAADVLLLYLSAGERNEEAQLHSALWV